MPPPHRCFIDGRYMLHGRPLLLVAGEVHNSGSSTPAAIETALDAAIRLGVETVLAPVAWESIEPEEGQFDFSLVDALVNAARVRGLHLIPLWFGTWKNGMSTYAPIWVKGDPQRFPRILNSDGLILEAVTPFSDLARDADAHAFAALMRHLASVDDGKTILMVQVENEVGVLSDARDRSPLAESRWNQPVPTEVRDAIAASGSGRLFDALQLGSRHKSADWSSLLGDEAEEAFMTSAYASYIETVARAGREEFDVPLFVNAWVDANAESDGGDTDFALAGGVRPGEYPSGGPLRHTASIWRALAPSLDFLAPDLYFGSFDTIAEAYRAIGGILFIPEMQCNRTGVEQMFRAVGQLGAAGVAPFAFDLMREDDAHYDEVRDAFALLAALGTVLAQHPDAELRGFTLTAQEPSRELFDGSLEVTSKHMSEIFPSPQNGVGCVARITKDSYVVIGRGFAVRPLNGLGQRGAWAAVEELERADDGFTVRRRLNGDEIGGGEWVRLPIVNQTQSDLFPIRQNLHLSGVLRATTYSATPPTAVVPERTVPNR